jgi:hypothetical protein
MLSLNSKHVHYVKIYLPNLEHFDEKRAITPKMGNGFYFKIAG